MSREVIAGMSVALNTLPAIYRTNNDLKINRWVVQHGAAAILPRKKSERAVSVIITAKIIIWKPSTPSYNGLIEKLQRNSKSLKKRIYLS